MDQPPIQTPKQTSTTARPQRVQYPPNRRLDRMRAFSTLLDNSIPLPGGYRMGLDPLIGLIPGIGDAIASTLSVWLIYQAARLGMGKRILARMVGNIIIETAAGAIPVLGDIFDVTWKANIRNMRLVEATYSPAMRERSRTRLALFILAVLVIIYGTLSLVFYLVMRSLQSLSGL
jgi:hypothetical protein